MPPPTAGLPRLVLLTGHCAPINCLAFSPDHTTLATGSYDHSVILWDLPAGTMRARLGGHHYGLHVAFSPDGATLATADGEAVRLWDVRTGRWLGTIPGFSGPIAFADHSTLIAAVWGEALVRLDSESGQVLGRLPLVAAEEDMLCTSAISPDRSTIAAAIYQNGQSLRVWDFTTGTLLRRRSVPGILRWMVRDPETGKLRPTHGAQAEVSHLAISPNNRTLAVGGRMTLWLCDLRTGRRTHLLLCGLDGAMSLAFSADGKVLAAGTVSGAVKLWVLPSGRELRNIPAHAGWTAAVGFSPDNRLVASSSHDKTIKVWEVDTGECRHALVGLEHEALCVTYSPDGTILASGHQDGTVRLWDPAKGTLRGTLRCRCRQVTSLCFSDDGRTLATCSYDRWDQVSQGAVELWEIPGGTRAQFWETGLGMIDAVAFVPGTTRVVASRRDAAGEATLAWDTATGVCLFQVEGREVAVSPDGSYLATTVGWNGKICLWDAETGALLHELATSEVSDWIVSLRFGPDGRTLFGGFSGFGIGAWSVETGELLWDVGAHADFISSLAVSPDSRALAVGGSYQSGLVLWDIQGRPRERLTLSGHDSNLLSACFSPSGDRLATAAADGTVRLWDPVDGRLLATLLVLPLPGGAVSEEWITYTPAGYYLGSAGAEAFVRWQVDAELLPAETYRQEFRRLDLVAELLAASSG